jgi:hypothetical protein
MPGSSQKKARPRNLVRASISRWRNAIDNYGVKYRRDIERSERELLLRLAGDPDVSMALERLNIKTSEQELSIVAACVAAGKLARTFRLRIKKEQEMLARLERLRTGVSDLRVFVKEQKRRREFVDGYRAISEEDGLRMVRCKLPELADMQRGLDLIASLIDGRVDVAKTTELALGATRKKDHQHAADNAAIYQLAQWILRVTGKPHQKEVNELAEAILGGEISEHRVCRAARRHRL